MAGILTSYDTSVSNTPEEDELFNQKAFNALADSRSTPWHPSARSFTTSAPYLEPRTPTWLRSRHSPDLIPQGGLFTTPALSISGSSQHYTDPATHTPLFLDDQDSQRTETYFVQSRQGFEGSQEDHLEGIASNPTLSPPLPHLDPAFSDDTDIQLTTSPWQYQDPVSGSDSSPKPDLALTHRHGQLLSPLRFVDNSGSQYLPNHDHGATHHDSPTPLPRPPISAQASKHRSSSRVTSGSKKFQKNFSVILSAPANSPLKRRNNSPGQQLARSHGSRRKPPAMTGFISSFALDGRVARKKMDPEHRQQASTNRKDGVCAFCKIRKWPCQPPAEGQPRVPCKCCNERYTTEDIERYQLCFKDLCDYMNGVSMFRRESPLHGPPRKQQPIVWVTNATVDLLVSLTSSVPSQPLRIRCRHFKPQDDDLTERLWGASEPIAIAPYAVFDLDACKQALGRGYLRSLIPHFLQLHESQGCPVLMKETLHVARTYSADHPESLVDMAFDIWVGTRVCAYDKSLVGPETLGLNQVNEPGALLQGLKPIPPKIDNQTDNIMIEIMTETAQKIYEELNDRITRPKTDNGIEIFLTLFVLVNSVEFLIEQQEIFKNEWRKNGETHGSGGATPKPTAKRRQLMQKCIAQSEAFISEWKRSAEKLIHLWQIYMGGTWFPFKTSAIASIKPELHKEKEYVQHVIDILEKGLIGQRCSVLANTREFSQEMVWAQKLFEQPKSKRGNK